MAEEQGRSSLVAELAEARRQLDNATRQLAEAQQRQARAAAKAEDQADRADKWESECIGECALHTCSNRCKTSFL